MMPKFMTIIQGLFRRAFVSGKKESKETERELERAETLPDIQRRETRNREEREQYLGRAEHIE